MIKLTIEGSVDDVEDFLCDLAGVDDSPAPVSVPQPAHQEYLLEDRIYRKLEEKLKEKKKDSVLPGSSGPVLQQDRKPNALEKFMEERANLKRKPVVSVPNAPDDPERDRGRKNMITPLPTKKSLSIPVFEWGQDDESRYGSLVFAERRDGGVVLRYFSATVFTTKEKILQIPYPVPKGYLKLCGAPNAITAIRLYRAYLASGNSVHPDKEIEDQDPDRKEEKDPDEPFKPMLKGAFSTRPGKEDIDKIEGSLER